MICTSCYLPTSPIWFSFMLAVDWALSYSWPFYLLPNTLPQLSDKLIFHCYCYIHKECYYWAKKCTITSFPVLNNCFVVLLSNNCLILLLSIFCENLSVSALSQGFKKIPFNITHYTVKKSDNVLGFFFFFKNFPWRLPSPLDTRHSLLQPCLLLPNSTRLSPWNSPLFSLS